MLSIVQAARSRLWIRLTLILLAASLLPLAGAGTLTLLQIEKSVQRDAKRRHDALADLGAGMVRALITRGQEKLVTMSRLLGKELPDELSFAANDKQQRKRIVDRLNHLVEPPDMFLELQYYKASEKIGLPAKFVGQARQLEFETSQSLMPNIEVQRRNQILENIRLEVVQTPLLTNSPFVNLAPQEVFGFPSLPISMPVHSGEPSEKAASTEKAAGSKVTNSGKPAGVLVSYLDLRKLKDLLSPLADGGYRVRLTGGEGLITEVGSLSGEGIGSSERVGHADWIIEVTEPTRVVEEALRDTRGQVLLWLALAVVLAVVLSLVLSAWIGKPVNALTRAARRMEAGDLSARSGIIGEHELGQLGAAFDRMAKALETLDQAKTDFIANVSHELRSPLTSMRLGIANLNDGVVGPIAEKPKRTLLRIQRDVDRLIALVNDLLEMARLQAGADEPRRVEVDVAEIARDAVATLDELAIEKDVEVRVAGSGRATVDPAMLTRIISNLVDNAIKFSPAGGTVRITAADCELSVADEGPGFQGDDFFERFRQGSQEGVKNQGAGLGLAIVKKLVELHGGSIEHSEGEGATLIVRF